MNFFSEAKVSRDCRILPRQSFFFQELDHIYGNGNLTLGIEGKSFYLIECSVYKFIMRIDI